MPLFPGTGECRFNGLHLVHRLLNQVVVLDDLSTGRVAQWAVADDSPTKAPFLRARER